MVMFCDMILIKVVGMQLMNILYTCFTSLPRASGWSCSHSSRRAAKMLSASRMERPRLQTRVMA